MRLATFSIPDGWTYNDYRSFLQSELAEDKPGNAEYPWLVDFDEASLIFSDDSGTTYQIGYAVTQSDAGKDVVWAGDPAEVAQRTTYEKVAEMAAFSLDTTPTVEGDFVLRSGKVFEVGEYPEKKFSLTAEEATAAIAAFTPVDNRVSHRSGPDRTPTVFDGKMGELRSVEMAADGKTILGTVAIPKWFDEFHTTHYPGEPIKASLEWTYDSKNILGNTLIPNPHIADSALFEAYAAFAAGTDGVPGEKKEHDMPTAPEKVTAPTATFTDADVAALRAELDAEKAKNTSNTASLARIKADRIEEQAAAFAKEQIAASKAVPAQEQALKAAFTQAAQDDDANPAVVTFAEGEAGKGGRVEALRGLYAVAPANVLMQHMADGQTGLAAFAAPKKDENLQKLYDDTAKAAEKSNPKR